MKKVMAILLLTIMTLSTMIPASAQSMDARADVEGMFLIETRQTVLDDGSLLTEQIYTDVNPRLRRSDHGEAHVVDDATLKFDDDTGVEKTCSFTLWADFIWDKNDNTCYLDGYGKSNEKLPSGITLAESDINTKDNEGMGILNRYAQVTWDISVENRVGMGKSLSLKVKCESDGDVS